MRYFFKTQENESIISIVTNVGVLLVSAVFVFIIICIIIIIISVVVVVVSRLTLDSG